MSKVILLLTQLPNTKRDLLERIDMNPPNTYGPRSLLNLIQQKNIKFLEPAMQVIADRIVLIAASNLEVERLRRGDLHFALVYLTLIIATDRPAFIEYLQGALEAACPYILPGRTEQIAAESVGLPNEVKRKRLGYKDLSEMDDTYILRMQSIVAFYGALLQTTSQDMERNAKPFHVQTWKNPFGGIEQAWRWIARTLNSKIFRWSKYIIQAFLWYYRSKLIAIFSNSNKENFRMMKSSEFTKVCEQAARHPEDDDRTQVFVLFVAESLAQFKKDGKLSPPGKFDEDEGRWVDPRILQASAIENVN